MGLKSRVFIEISAISVSTYDVFRMITYRFS